MSYLYRAPQAASDSTREKLVDFYRKVPCFPRPNPPNLLNPPNRLGNTQASDSYAYRRVIVVLLYRRVECKKSGVVEREGMLIYSYLEGLVVGGCIGV